MMRDFIKPYLFVLFTYVVISLISAPVFGASQLPLKPDVYLGIMSGYAAVDYQKHIVLPDISATLIKNSGFANNIFIGYDFTQHWGIELNILYLTQHPAYQVSSTGETLKIKNTLVSLMPKFTIFLNHRLAFNLRAGIGYVARNAVIENGMKLLPSDEFLVPALGAELQYEFTRHWYATFGWLYSFRRDNKQLSSINFLGGGIIYHFKLGI